jgi:hypothetical protein
MVEPYLDIAGHIFYVFLFGGQFLLAKKIRLGWVLRLIGELGWLGIGIKLGMSSVWFWGIFGIGMECYGFWSWRSKRAKATHICSD